MENTEEVIGFKSKKCISTNWMAVIVTVICSAAMVLLTGAESVPSEMVGVLIGLAVLIAVAGVVSLIRVIKLMRWPKELVKVTANSIKLHHPKCEIKFADIHSVEAKGDMTTSGRNLVDQLSNINRLSFGHIIIYTKDGGKHKQWCVADVYQVAEILTSKISKQ